MIFRQHHKPCVALVGAAILAQLQLIFVVELHHHGSRQSLADGQGQVSADMTQWQSAPAQDPVCAACRVSQQGGAILLAAATPLPARDSSERKLPASRDLQFVRRLSSRLRSRAPPLS